MVTFVKKRRIWKPSDRRKRRRKVKTKMNVSSPFYAHKGAARGVAVKKAPETTTCPNRDPLTEVDVYLLRLQMSTTA